ncbi:MAG: protein kinase domain-containing protein, partial [Planctomycetota bacterium]
MPVGEALELAVGIASGLEAAHDVGVIHRDLKPDNIKITPDGKVKVLDFGLAKSSPESSATKLADSPTLTTPRSPTIPGAILGTAAYMSPEQARGKTVDKRADIWSFGVVLFELLTGTRLFEGEAVSDTLAEVLKHEIPWERLPKDTPRALAQVLNRCLIRDPRDRLRDIGEVRLALGEGGVHAAQPDAGAAAGAPRSSFPVAGWIGAIVIIGLAGWWIGKQDRDPVETWSQFTQLTDLEGAETAPALSSDGGSFAYASRAAGSWDIYVQRVGGRNPIAVAADPERDELWPAFSPDGSQIAYNDAGGVGGIWVVGATGESDRRVTDFGFNPTWSHDGKHIAFASASIDSPYDRQGRSALWRVPAAGGTPVQLTDQDAVQPAWSPSGARIAVWFHEGGQRDLATVPADGGERLVLLDDAPLDWSPTWSPDGRYLYFSSDRGGSMGLWRLPIDEASGRARGAPEPVANGLEASMSLPSFSEDGRVLAFRSESVSVNPVVIPFDPDTERAGPPRELLRRTGSLRPSSVSPDGEWLALDNRGEQREDIFLLRTDGTELRRLTDDAARDRLPRFSPDGALLTFHSNRGGKYSGYSIRVDGSALTLLTDPSIGNVAGPMFEPAGERLFFYVENDAFYLGSPPWPASLSAAERFAKIGELSPTYSSWCWSPDGRRLAGRLKSETPGGGGLGIYDPALREGRLVLAEESEFAAAWLPDSRRIVYFTQDHELVVVDVETAERRVISVDLPFPPADEFIAVAPDGTALYYG